MEHTNLGSFSLRRKEGRCRRSMGVRRRAARIICEELANEKAVWLGGGGHPGLVHGLYWMRGRRERACRDKARDLIKVEQPARKSLRESDACANMIRPDVPARLQRVAVAQPLSPSLSADQPGR